jgi:hypothetical protein
MNAVRLVIASIIILARLGEAQPSPKGSNSPNDLPKPASNPLQALAIVDLRNTTNSALDSTDREGADIRVFRQSDIGSVIASCEDFLRMKDSASLVLTDLRQAAACALHSRPNDTSIVRLRRRLKAAHYLAIIAAGQEKKSSLRMLTRKGDSVLYISLQTATLLAKHADVPKGTVAWDDKRCPLFVMGRRPIIKTKETDRETQLSEDITTLGKLAIAVGSSALKGPGIEGMTDCTPDSSHIDTLLVTWATYDKRALKLERAKLDFSASIRDEPVVLASAMTPELQRAFFDAQRLKAEREVAEKTRSSGKADAVKCATVNDIVVPRDTTTINSLVCLVRNARQEPRQRLAAISALGERGGVVAEGELQRLALGKENASVVEAAIAALGKSGVVAQSANTTPSPSSQARAPIQVLAATLLTGPAEHWFLSTDVAVNGSDAADVSIDDDGKPVVGEKPTRFHIGANYLIGDLVDPSRRSFIQNVYLKAMITASSRPLDSYGVALGLRGSFLKNLNINLDLLSPWIGYTWTKADDVDGEATSRERRAKTLRYGVGLNLDKALDWISK